MCAKNYLTPAGHKKLKDELIQLKDTKRIDVAAKIKEAREVGGDILENSVYDTAIEEQSYIEGRIVELEEILANSKVLDRQHAKCDEVDIGCTVLVELEKDQHEFTIVGSVEADPSKKLISNESPVGQALLGSKVGDTVEVSTPILTAKYKILEIK